MINKGIETIVNQTTVLKGHGKFTEIRNSYFKPDGFDYGVNSV